MKAIGSILLDAEKNFGLVADGIGGGARRNIASRMFAGIAKNVFRYEGPIRFGRPFEVILYESSEF